MYCRTGTSMGVVSTQPLQALLENAFPDATELNVEDRTGGGDHFQVTVASPRFSGLSPAITRRQSPPLPLARQSSLAAVKCGLWLGARDPEGRHYWTGH